MHVAVVVGEDSLLSRYLLRALAPRATHVSWVLPGSGGAIARLREVALLSSSRDAEMPPVFFYLSSPDAGPGAAPSPARSAAGEVLEAALAAFSFHGCRFVLVSTAGVHGFSESMPVDELSPFAPWSPAARDALALEALLRGSVGQHERVIVRPSLMYGAGDADGPMATLFSRCRQGRHRRPSADENVVHVAHVDDIVEGVLLAATHPAAPGEEFILCGKECMTYGALATLAGDLSDAPPPPLVPGLSTLRGTFEKARAALPRVVRSARLLSLLPPEGQGALSRSVVYSAAKARALLGYSPRVGYGEGVLRALYDCPPEAPERLA